MPEGDSSQRGSVASRLALFEENSPGNSPIKREIAGNPSVVETVDDDLTMPSMSSREENGHPGETESARHCSATSDDGNVKQNEDGWEDKSDSDHLAKAESVVSGDVGEVVDKEKSGEAKKRKRKGEGSAKRTKSMNMNGTDAADDEKSSMGAAKEQENGTCSRKASKEKSDQKSRDMSVGDETPRKNDFARVPSELQSPREDPLQPQKKTKKHPSITPRKGKRSSVRTSRGASGASTGSGFQFKEAKSPVPPVLGELASSETGIKGGEKLAEEMSLEETDLLDPPSPPEEPVTDAVIGKPRRFEDVLIDELPLLHPDARDTPLDPTFRDSSEELFTPVPLWAPPPSARGKKKKKRGKTTSRSKKSSRKSKAGDKSSVNKIILAAIGMNSRMNTVLDLVLQNYGDFFALKAVSDDSQSAVSYAKQRFSAYGNVESFRDYRKLLRRKEVSWVFVGSKTSLHSVHCLAALKAGKNVYCESPLALTPEQCEELRQAQIQSGKSLYFSNSLFCSSIFTKLLEIVKSGTLGRVVSIEANGLELFNRGGHVMRTWKRHKKEGGPLILSQNVNDLVALCLLADSLPSRVVAFGGLSHFTPENKPENVADAKEYKSWAVEEEPAVDPFCVGKDISDDQMVLLEFRNHVRAMFHTCCNAAFPQKRILISGVRGTLEGDLLSGRLKFKCIGQSSQTQTVEVDKSSALDDDQAMIADLVNCMKTGSSPRVTLDKALESAEIACAVEGACSSGSVVDLEQVWKKHDL